MIKNLLTSTSGELITSITPDVILAFGREDAADWYANPVSASGITVGDFVLFVFAFDNHEQASTISSTGLNSVTVVADTTDTKHNPGSYIVYGTATATTVTFSIDLNSASDFEGLAGILASFKHVSSIEDCSDLNPEAANPMSFANPVSTVNSHSIICICLMDDYDAVENFIQTGYTKVTQSQYTNSDHYHSGTLITYFNNYDIIGGSTIPPDISFSSYSDDCDLLSLSCIAKEHTPEPIPVFPIRGRWNEPNNGNNTDTFSFSNSVAGDYIIAASSSDGNIVANNSNPTFTTDYNDSGVDGTSFAGLYYRIATSDIESESISYDISSYGRASVAVAIGNVSSRTDFGYSAPHVATPPNGTVSAVDSYCIVVVHIQDDYTTAPILSGFDLLVINSNNYANYIDQTAIFGKYYPLGGTITPPDITGIASGYIMRIATWVLQ